MKKINIILIIAIIITLIAIIVKISKQDVVVERKFSDTNESEEQLLYEVERKVKYGESGENSEFNDQGVKINTSEEMKKEQEIEKGLTVKGFSLEYNSGYTYIYAKVSNITNKDMGGYPVIIVLLDENNQEVSKYNSYLNIIEPGSDGSITTSIPGDLTDGYKIEVKKAEEVE